MMCHASINQYQFGIGCIKHKIGLKHFRPLAVSVYYVKNVVYFHTLYCKTFSFSSINYFLRPPPSAALVGPVVDIFGVQFYVTLYFSVIIFILFITLLYLISGLMPFMTSHYINVI